MLKRVAKQDVEGCLLQDMCVKLELDTGDLHGEVLCAAYSPAGSAIGALHS